MTKKSNLPKAKFHTKKKVLLCSRGALFFKSERPAAYCRKAVWRWWYAQSEEHKHSNRYQASVPYRCQLCLWWCIWILLFPRIFTSSQCWIFSGPCRIGTILSSRDAMLSLAIMLHQCCFFPIFLAAAHDCVPGSLGSLTEVNSSFSRKIKVLASSPQQANLNHAIFGSPSCLNWRLRLLLTRLKKPPLKGDENLAQIWLGVDKNLRVAQGWRSRGEEREV